MPDPVRLPFAAFATALLLSACASGPGDADLLNAGAADTEGGPGYSVEDDQVVEIDGVEDDIIE